MQGNFFNASISYGSLDNKFVFQLICRIPAPHGSNYLILLCSGLWILLPDQAAHLSERKRNFNQRDTYCKKKKIETVSKFKNLVNKNTTMRGIFVILNAGFVVQLTLPYTLTPFKKVDRSYQKTRKKVT